MTTLNITFPLTYPDATALFDYVQSSDGFTATAHASVPLALLPTGHDDVVALVPAQALSWHQIKLPAGSVPRNLSGERAGSRLRAILDGALEDQLLDEPAQLHLALQPQPASDALVWVAACDRAWLKTRLDVLAQAGHAVGRIVPEFTPQALADTVLVTGDADWPRVAGLQRLPADGESGTRLTGGLLSCALGTPALAWLGESENHDGADLPRVVAEPAVVALAEARFKRPVSLLPHAERLLQAAQSPWNLAQFELAHAGRDRRWASVTQALTSFLRSPPWRPARWALVSLLLVQLLGLNAWALREQAALNAKSRAVRALLTDTFPKVQVVVDAPLQMAREVAALQRASGTAAGSDLESMLALFSALAPENYSATAIEFVAGELRLKGTGVADPAALAGQLKAAGLRASQQGDAWLITAGGQP